MKVFSAAQIKQWDAYTIAHEPVSSADLMERAAAACVNWLQQHYSSKQSYIILCGKGNNGGDGLAIARMLVQQKHAVAVYILDTGNEGSSDFKLNLKKLETCTFNIHHIRTAADFPEISKSNIVIDALFGTGLNKPLTGTAASLATHINWAGAPVIAVDMPSGLFADYTSKGNVIVAASHTLSFQQPKLAFLLAENDTCCGEVHILDINLSRQFAQQEDAVYFVTDHTAAATIYRGRKKYAHKGIYGHAVLVAGSYGMTGAAVLSAAGCLRSGAGKLTCVVPECGYTVLQTAVPEALCKVSGKEIIESAGNIDRFDAIGIGPGIGLHEQHSSLLRSVFQASTKNLVLDADALNTLSLNKELLPLLPPASVLTPHPREFERLFGKTTNDFERLQLAMQKSKEYNSYIILKGHNSFISTPDGKGYFNSTGNAGMATAGSGDVLTGIITGLLAQQYTPFEACILGTYLHGAAGDEAAKKYSEEAMLAGDIAQNLGTVFKSLRNEEPV